MAKRVANKGTTERFRLLFPVLFVFLWNSGITSSGAAQVIDYSEVDRATVRVLVVKSVHMQVVPVSSGSQTIAIPDVSHGSGVAITAGGLVLTAHHVVDGARALAIKVPGDDVSYPARIIHEDSESDFAILRTSKKFDDFLPLANSMRNLRVREHVHALGYPVDARIPFPLSSPGIIAGILSEGFIQLGMSLNPGNSGGPIIDSEDRLIGIVVARGDPSQGVLGLGVALPIEVVSSAMKQLTIKGRDTALSLWTPQEKRLAFIAATLSETGPAGMLREASQLLRELDGSSLSELQILAMAEVRADLTLFAAAYHWDAVVMLLEETGGVFHTDDPRGVLFRNYLKRTVQLCHAAIAKEPDVSAESSFVNYIVNRWPKPDAVLQFTQNKRATLSARSLDRSGSSVSDIQSQ